jgi:hypothetical protein
MLLRLMKEAARIKQGGFWCLLLIGRQGLVFGFGPVLDPHNIGDLALLHAPSGPGKTGESHLGLNCGLGRVVMVFAGLF